MIILKDIRCPPLQSVQVELPRANMAIDPRPNGNDGRDRFRCEYHDNGTTVTLTRTANFGWTLSFDFRVYDPATETVPSFDSTIYTYLGEDSERAPYDTTVLIIHPSVRVIKLSAFSHCQEIEKCFMHDGVHTIEEYAFFCCIAMKMIRLSQSLTHIGEGAFAHCSTLEAVFLPPSINKIDKYAFACCENLRIFPLPLNIGVSHIGSRVLLRCNNFFETTQIEEYDYEDVDVDDDNDNNRVNQEIIHFYRDQVPPLHKASLHTHVTNQTIQECIDRHGQATASIADHDGMTPLHILAMNPHADISAIFACFDLNRSIAFVEDSRGNTPLDYLRVHHDRIEYHTSLASSLCMHWDAARGAQRGLSTKPTPTTNETNNASTNNASYTHAL